MSLGDDIITFDDIEEEDDGEEVSEEEDAAHPADSLIIKKAEDRLVDAKEVAASLTLPRILEVTGRQASESGELPGDLPSSSSTGDLQLNIAEPATAEPAVGTSKRKQILTESERQAWGEAEAADSRSAKPSRLAKNSRIETGKRKHISSDFNREVKAKRSSPGDSDGSDDLDALVMRSAQPSPSSSEGRRKAQKVADEEEPMPAPIGVTVIGDDEEEVQTNMQRILRKSRYFTAHNFGESAKKCFNCGQLGHFSRDCTNTRAQRPCFLCAKFGHSDSQCPQGRVRCYKCGGAGHMARDCTKSANSLERQLVENRVCVRCGDPRCAASNAPDYVRAEGGCTGEISQEDMRLTVCQDCGRKGHFSCKPVRADPALTYCFNCGQKGHLGTQCQVISPTDEVRREKTERYSQQAPKSGGRSDRSGGSAGRSEQKRSFWEHDTRTAGRDAREESNSHSRFQVDFSAPATAIAYNRVAPPPLNATPPGYAPLPPQHPNGAPGYRPYGQGGYTQGAYAQSPYAQVYTGTPPAQVGPDTWRAQVGLSPDGGSGSWMNARR